MLVHPPATFINLDHAFLLELSDDVLNASPFKGESSFQSL
jgi:hypothetical protein